MSKQTLTIELLVKYAKLFCIEIESAGLSELYGVTDGKAVGTAIEAKFKEFLRKHCQFEHGSAAKGLDLPSIETDIKVTSIKQPQSSSPYKYMEQKIYGLGYNLILFVYEKNDNHFKKVSELTFHTCAFIPREYTGDHTITSDISKIVNTGYSREDKIQALKNLFGTKKLPDEAKYQSLAEEILVNPPKIGYLTISNALQWRLQYGRVHTQKNELDGVVVIK